MPLTLITGPANAGKAELVFGAVREHAMRGAEPWLVLPTAADVRHYTRELARGGAALGVRVASFHQLADEVARRCGCGARLIDDFSREHLLAALAGGRPPDAGSGARALGKPPGDARAAGPARAYVRELAAIVAQLESLRVDPASLRSALATWERRGGAAARGAATRARALATLFAGYQAALARLGLEDREHRAACAFAAVREHRCAWSSPVLFYGFDDLTPPQLDAIEALGVHGEAHVTVALAFEPGRAAFAERASAFERLRPWASERVSLPAADRHYAPAARATLSRLERGLFEDVREREPAGVALRLLEGASARAELELVAAQIGALLERGFDPEQIVIVHRTPAAVGALASEVLGSRGVPLAWERTRRFAQTALGGALLGLLRCATAQGLADDLLRWLRAPGVVRRQELVDRLERAVLTEGARSAEQARALWERERWPLEALDRIREAAGRGPLALVARVEAELWRLFDAPRRGVGKPLDRDELDEAGALRAGLGALAKLRLLAERVSPAVASPEAIVASLEELALERRSAGETEGAVMLVSPLALRARRVRAVFLCGLQEGVFPAPPRAPAYLDADERRALEAASGLALSHDLEAALGRERYLLYACLSRAEELVVLSWHAADDDGAETPRSLFVDDVCDLFEPELLDERIRGGERADGVRAADDVATVAPGSRALSALSDPRVLAELGNRDWLWSASALESWSRCPARWFVERFLRLGSLEPEPEQRALGTVIHGVLGDVLEGLRKELGSARLEPARLELAYELMGAAIERRCAERPLSAVPELERAARRRLHAELARYLAFAAARDDSLEPVHVELAFGFAAGEVSLSDEAAQMQLPPLDLGEGVRVRGRIDRVDVGPDGEAVVYDYKRGLHDDMPAARWLAAGNLQMALYMRAVEKLLGLEVVGGVYQPVTGAKLVGRGAVSDGASAEQVAESVRGDRFEREELRGLVDAVSAGARAAALEARAGRLEGRPATCSDRGCLYPAICRCGA
jgi:RecB family exonuclease